jgi:hypothetical protein
MAQVVRTQGPEFSDAKKTQKTKDDLRLHLVTPKPRTALHLAA